MTRKYKFLLTKEESALLFHWLNCYENIEDDEEHNKEMENLTNKIIEQLNKQELKQ